MNKTTVFVLTAVLLCGACKGKTEARPRKSKASARPARAAPPYDMAPMARMLRPGVARELRRQLKVRALTDLPFYDMNLTLVPLEARLEGRYTLYYLNRTGRSVPALPLLLHPNTPRELGGPNTSSLLKVTAAKSLSGPAIKSIQKVRLTLTKLRLERPLKPGERIKLEVRFAGTIRRLPPGQNDVFSQAFSSLGMSSSGAAASDYGLLAVGDGIITLASAYPMVAPFRGGRFDTSPPTRFGDLAYNDLCHFRARVTVPAGFKVVTNLLDEEPRASVGGKLVTYTAAGAANRDLVLVAGRDLVRTTASVGKIKVTSVHKARDAAGGRLILETARKSLAFFQLRFGPYPFVEMDAAEATLVGGAGGVEFPGMVLVAGMLYRPPSKSASPMGQLMKMMGGLGSMLGGAMGGAGGGGADLKVPAGGMKMMDAMIQKMAVFTTAHEVAHQYFAGLVGSDCRQEPALDEPLAQFAAGEYVRAQLGDAAGREMFDMNAKLNYGVYRLMGGKDRAVAQPVKKFPSAISYAAIVYGKAPYFYMDLQKRLGPERLNRALRKAVDDNRFKIITLDQWLRSMARGSGGKGKLIRSRARRWFHGTHGDKDLGVDDSGDLVLKTVLGQQGHAELKEGMALLGMKPADLFKMLLGNLMSGEL